jgi:hypothetical protein
MAAVIQHSFRALITFGPSAPESLMRAYLDGTLTTCVVQPRSGIYFPAVLACRESSPPRPAVHAVLSIPLSSGETEAFFAPGQRFIIWADAIVGHTTCGDGLVSHGIISGQESRLRRVRPREGERRRRPSAHNSPTSTSIHGPPTQDRTIASRPQCRWTRRLITSLARPPTEAAPPTRTSHEVPAGRRSRTSTSVWPPVRHGCDGAGETTGGASADS